MYRNDQMLCMRLLLACALFFPGLSDASSLCARERVDRGNLVIALDIGHSIEVPGARSARGKPEYKFNFDMGKVLLSVLKERGYDKSFILDESGRNIELLERVKIASAAGSDLFISIHHDSVQPAYLSAWKVNGKIQYYSDRFSGYSLFYSGENRYPECSLVLARLIGQYMSAIGLSPTSHHAEPIEGENREFVDPARGVYRFDQLAVLRSTTMPAVLVEFGIIVNRSDELTLGDQSYQLRVARSIVDALDEAISGQLRR